MYPMHLCHSRLISYTKVGACDLLYIYIHLLDKEANKDETNHNCMHDISSSTYFTISILTGIHVATQGTL